MKRVFKRLSMIALVAALALVGAMINPITAQADPPTSTIGNMDYTEGQSGDAIYMGPVSDYCPDDISGQNVYAVFTDSDSDVTTTQISSTGSVDDWGVYGMWLQGVWVIPSGVHLGLGSLQVECLQGSTVTKSYVPFDFTIVGQSTGMSLSSTHLLSNAVLSSSVGCPYASYVSAGVFSEQTQWMNGGAQSVGWESTQILSYGATSVTSATNGNQWTMNITLDEADFVPGHTYSIRVQCSTLGSRPPGIATYYNLDSYKFTVNSPEYVAMGDSYSAGLGSFNYDLESGDCYRSTDSYPYYLVDNNVLDTPIDAACSGAVTDDLYNDNPNVAYEEAQLDHLTSDTQDVTLTIGGNDAGFSDVVGDCATHLGNIGWSCATNTTMTSQLSTRLGALAGTSSGTGVGPGSRNVHSIKSVIGSIAADAPSAKIYIAGYPHLFGESSADYTVDGDAPGGYKCIVHGSGLTEVSVSLWDAEYLNDQADALNTIISDAVADEHTSHGVDVTYVSPSSFDGHGLCDSGTSWLNGVLLYSTGDPKPESFHPTVTGMQSGYGAAFADAIG